MFAIACVVDTLNGNNAYDLIYDQAEMREHLFASSKQQNYSMSALRKKNIEKNCYM